MVIGISSYILFDTFYPQPLGMHSVTLPVVMSLIGFVIVSLLTNKYTSSQTDEHLQRGVGK